MGSDICWVRPSDQVGSIDNILSRLDEYEKIVSRLEAINVQVQNLADLAAGTGVIRDFELLAGEGWPGDGQYTGYSMSSVPLPIPEEEQFAVAVMEDGRVIYGYRAAGTIAGSATVGDTGIYTSDGSCVAPPCILRFGTNTASSLVSNLGDSLRINQTATYMIAMSGFMYRPGGSVYALGLLTLELEGFAENIQSTHLMPGGSSAIGRINGGGVMIRNISAGTRIIGKADLLAGSFIPAIMFVTISKIVPTQQEEA